MTFEQIKTLIDIVCQKGLHELEIERSDFRVKIVGGAPAGAVVTAAATADAAVPALPASSPSPPPESASEPAGGHTIASPIVGTFYSAPSPDSDPYVQVGERVSAGQVLCIVEAMKLMNEIESDVDGEVVNVLPANAQPVEFGEPLFIIRADS